MSKKNKIRRLSDVIVDIRKEINNNESQENKDAVRVLLDEANQIIDKNKKADKGIGYAMLLMFGVIIYFGVSLYQADNQISLLNDDIVEKEIQSIIFNGRILYLLNSWIYLMIL